MWKKRRQVRTFFNFCAAQGWLERNPAEGLSKPIGLDSPATLPLLAQAIRGHP
jgi:site-specific recombinase XerD